MLSVVIPIYNEADTIGADIDQIRDCLVKASIVHEIIVVDDGSKDNGGEIARQRNARVITHSVNRGVGAGRKTGILNAKYSIIATTDGDGTYPNHEMPKLLSYLPEYDMAVGARTGDNVYTSLIRFLPKFLIRKVAEYLTASKIPDLNSGLRIFKKETALKYFYLLPNSHSWESTITIAFLSNNNPIKFMPVDYFKRKGGKSSFTPFRDTYNYISLVVRTVMYFNPLRIFMPTIALFVLLAAASALVDIFVYVHISATTLVILMLTLNLIITALLADLIVTTNRKIG